MKQYPGFAMFSLFRSHDFISRTFLSNQQFFVNLNHADLSLQHLQAEIVSGS